ncbi:MAG: EAL domain-containing protein, partial [Synergistaceae bacterium]|nr:EAL domain-containing protein [Synergistaceae bacterium]
GLPIVPVSVNLSRLDFELCDIIREIELSLMLNDIPRKMMKIEITESVNEEDTTVLNLGIEKLRSLGYEVWMDDFGSGYSSLNVLKDYNFDTIKFDMKFLHGFDIARSEKAKYIISSNLEMARLMGMQALAEGVETEEQLEYLRSIGFDKGQGYFFGKPMTIDEIFLLGRGYEELR